MGFAPAGRQSFQLFWPLMVLVALATFALALIAGPIGALLPTLGVLFVYVLAKAPLRIPTLAIIFIALIVDNPADFGPWRTPLFKLGAHLLDQLKKNVPIGALVLTGVDTFLLLLLGIYAYRRFVSEKVDTLPRVRLPRALTLSCLAAIGAVLLAGVWGLITGGEFRWAQWQFMQMLHLPVIMLMFGALLPGPSVARTLMNVILAAACAKSVLALFVKSRFPEADFMTSHQDSVLFAVAFCNVCLRVMEEPIRRNLLVFAGIAPLLLAAMVVNDRRLVWAEIMLALAFVFYATRWSLIKFKLARAVMLAVPVALVYVAIGWSSAGAGIFKPVGTLRSMVDSRADTSTQWRDLENFNLHMTFKQNKVLGSGLGHPFVEAVPLPDVTSLYELEPYIPHNSMLGLWAYTGYVGFSIWWINLMVVAFLSLRGYRFARDPTERLTCMTTISALLVYMVHAHGDIGLGVWTALLTVGPLAGISAKIALSNGACQEPRAKAAPRVMHQAVIENPSPRLPERSSEASSR